MKHAWKLGLAALSLTTVALAATTLRLSIDGKAAGSAVIIGGQPYVPLSALKAAGVGVVQSGGALSLTLRGPAAPAGGQIGGVSGGAGAVAALEGCLGQTFFNGVWRVKLSDLKLSQADPSDPKWTIAAEVRNATGASLQPVFGGLSPDEAHLSVLAADGTPLSWSTGDLLAGQKLAYATLPPGGVWRGVLSIHDPNGASADRPPAKLLWQIKPAELATSLKLPWNVKDPSLRVDLRCQK